MFASFATFGTSEWLRLALTVLLCVPLFVVGMYMFGLFPEIIAGKDAGKRKRKGGETGKEETPEAEAGTRGSAEDKK